MYSDTDTLYMRRALELGARALLHATPNPRVGCVLVREGLVLGEGWTQVPGRSHAEVEALQDARNRGHDARGATAYVTLEPCSHFGRTPPCANALVEARVARVFAAVEDPNPLVSGRGFSLLRQAGIDVRCGLLRDEAIEANIGFFARMNRGRPWVRTKIAASLDGRTALPNGASRWITSAQARADGHAWRARACAVLTGAGTVRADDPELTVREVPTPRQPLRIVVDSTGALPPTARFFSAVPASAEGAPSVLVATARENADARARFADHPVEFRAFPGTDGGVDLAALLRHLGERGINELHVEAGARLNGALQAAGLVDELLLYLAPVLLGPGRPIMDLPALEAMADAAHWQMREAVRVGPDLRVLVRRADGADRAPPPEERPSPGR